MPKEKKVIPNFDQWKGFLANAMNTVLPENVEELIEHHKEAENHQMCVFIVDLATLTYFYVSENTEEIMGYPSVQFMKEGTKMLHNITHPDDRSKIYSSTQKAIQKILSLPVEERKYIMKFPYRVITPNGEIRWMLRQSHIVALDANGNPSLDCALLMDITPFKNDTIITCQIQWKSGSAIFYPDSEETEANFTKREIEVIKLIQKGITSKKIAEQLFISEETVKNHRKNIIKKASAKNMVDAMQKIRQLGIE